MVMADPCLKVPEEGEQGPCDSHGRELATEGQVQAKEAAGLKLPEGRRRERPFGSAQGDNEERLEKRRDKKARHGLRPRHTSAERPPPGPGA